jgi:hypothetical protein
MSKIPFEILLDSMISEAAPPDQSSWEVKTDYDKIDPGSIADGMWGWVSPEKKVYAAKFIDTRGQYQHPEMAKDIIKKEYPGLVKGPKTSMAEFNALLKAGWIRFRAGGPENAGTFAAQIDHGFDEAEGTLRGILEKLEGQWKNVELDYKDGGTKSWSGDMGTFIKFGIRASELARFRGTGGFGESLSRLLHSI